MSWQMSPEVTVIDYGLGNLFSVCRALEHCGAKPVVSSDPDAVANAGRLLLPGVGAFADGMALLSGLGLDEAIKKGVDKGSHLLGICLGMQFLLDYSEEFGHTQGLGLIQGGVIAIPDHTAAGVPVKIPHIGWNSLLPAHDKSSWAGSPLAPLWHGTPMYFVHSFMAVPENTGHRVADCLYGDTRVAAVIGCDNIWGTQFHPEKSGESGLAVLRQFISLR